MKILRVIKVDLKVCPFFRVDTNEAFLLAETTFVSLILYILLNTM